MTQHATPGTKLPGQDRHGPVLQSRVTADGELKLFFSDLEVGRPAHDEVVVAMRAAPVNPSDLGTLLAGADPSTAKRQGVGYDAVTTLQMSTTAQSVARARTGQALSVGNEGAGIVVAAGEDPRAEALLGSTVALLPTAGAFGHFVRTRASSCLALGAGAASVDGASALVNPMTALAMVATMAAEGHSALVHTAAASNLGRMLNRLCLADGIPLVNIVRSDAQRETLLRDGAEHVCVTTAPAFTAELTTALEATGATICFDAIGGGDLLGRVLAAMEAATAKTNISYNRYGSTHHKQGYIYGVLDGAPTTIPRSVGFAWSVGGWLLLPTLERFGPDVRAQIRRRVQVDLQTVFESEYALYVALPDILDPAVLASVSSRSTGGKYLLIVDHEL